MTTRTRNFIDELKGCKNARDVKSKTTFLLAELESEMIEAGFKLTCPSPNIERSRLAEESNERLVLFDHYEEVKFIDEGVRLNRWPVTLDGGRFTEIEADIIILLHNLNRSPH